jgi:hypothetical protein
MGSHFGERLLEVVRQLLLCGGHKFCGRIGRRHLEVRWPPIIRSPKSQRWQQIRRHGVPLGQRLAEVEQLPKGGQNRRVIEWMWRRSGRANDAASRYPRRYENGGDADPISVE